MYILFFFFFVLLLYPAGTQHGNLRQSVSVARRRVTYFSPQNPHRLPPYSYIHQREQEVCREFGTNESKWTGTRKKKKKKEREKRERKKMKRLHPCHRIRCKRGATHSCRCVHYFHVTKQWRGWQYLRV